MPPRLEEGEQVREVAHMVLHGGAREQPARSRVHTAQRLEAPRPGAGPQQVALVGDDAREGARRGQRLSRPGPHRAVVRHEAHGHLQVEAILAGREGLGGSPPGGAGRPLRGAPPPPPDGGGRLQERVGDASLLQGGAPLGHQGGGRHDEGALLLGPRRVEQEAHRHPGLAQAHVVREDAPAREGRAGRLPRHHPLDGLCLVCEEAEAGVGHSQAPLLGPGLGALSLRRHQQRLVLLLLHGV